MHLPLPPSGRIKSVIHVADLHIRAGEASKCRFEEYAGVFDAFGGSLRDIPAVQDGSAVLVVAGDTFHDKSTLSPAGILLFHRLLGWTKLARVPVYLIRGNHDFNQCINDLDEPDVIQAMLQGIDKTDALVEYLDVTGLYVAGDVGFGLLAIQDVLELGSNCGTNEDRTVEFPDPSGFSDAVTTRIALFHGAIAGCRLQNGRTGGIGDNESTLFAGYDCAMLGDIHLMQVHRARVATAIPPPISTVLGGGSAHLVRMWSWKEKGCWAYSGSLIQQNFGEPLLAHGFLVWDLDTRLLAAYHVRNAWGMVTLARANEDGGGGWGVRMQHRRIDPLMKLEDVASVPWFPRKVRVRVEHNDDDGADPIPIGGHVALTKELELRGLRVVDGIRESLVPTSRTATACCATTPDSSRATTSTGDDETAASTTITRAVSDLVASVQSADTWIEYVASHNNSAPNADDDWRAIFKDPALLRIPDELLPPTVVAASITSKLSDRNRKILKAVEEYRVLTERQAGQANGCRRTLCLRRMEWQWALCYGDNCYFDFDSATHQLVVLSGPNGAGKTAFLEMLFYGLFGVPFPSRSGAQASALINLAKPPQKRAFVRLHFRLDSECYWLYRCLDSSGERLTNKDVKICHVVAGGVQVQEVSGKSKVDSWVQEHIGDPDAFLQACMLTQHNDNDFFQLSPRQQMALLDKLLAMDGVAALTGAFKESVRAHKVARDLLQAAADSHLDVMRDLERMDPALHRDADRLADLEEACRTGSIQLKALEGEAQVTRDAWAAAVREYPPRRDGGYEVIAEEEEPVEPVVPFAELVAREQELKRRRQAWIDGGGETAAPLLDDDDDDDDDDMEALRQERERLVRTRCPPPRSTPEELAAWHPPSDAEIAEALARLEARVAAAPFKTHAEVARKLAEYQAWTAIADGDADADAASGRGQDDDVEELQNQLLTEQSALADLDDTIDALYKRPLSRRSDDATMRAWKEARLTLEANRPVDAHNRMNTALRKLQEIDAAERAHNAAAEVLRKDVNAFRTLKSQHQDIPSNPECWACKQQPWRMQLVDLRSRIYDVCKPAVADAEEQLGAALGGRTRMEWQLEADELSAWISAWDANESERAFWEEEEHRKDAADHWQMEWDNAKAERRRRQARVQELENAVERVQARLVRAQAANDWAALDLEGLDADFAEYANLRAIMDAQDYWHKERQAHTEFERWSASLDRVIRQLSLAEARELRREAAALAPETALLESQRTAWTAWGPWNVLRRKHAAERAAAALEDARNQWTDTKQRLVAATKHASVKNATQERLRGVSGALSKLNARCAMLERVVQPMDGFKAWVYEDRLMPLFVKQANNVMGTLTEEAMRLCVTWRDNKTAPGERFPLWHIMDAEGVRPPLEKASGFQRFLASFGTRIALAKLGACGVAPCRQLFIDEGFTSCDAANLERVPQFLQALRHGYSTVVLVTHLETLSRCATLRVPIRRDPHQAVARRICFPPPLPLPHQGDDHNDETLS